jgi:hypothetical protein
MGYACASMVSVIMYRVVAGRLTIAAMWMRMRMPLRLTSSSPSFADSTIVIEKCLLLVIGGRVKVACCARYRRRGVVQ